MLIPPWDQRGGAKTRLVLEKVVPKFLCSATSWLNGAGTQNGTCDLNLAKTLIGKVTACPAGFFCLPGPGAPKYGDYNASACCGGRLFAAWTSATTPSGSATPAAGLRTFTRTVIPNVP
jgi:hypothetical protein